MGNGESGREWILSKLNSFDECPDEAVRVLQLDDPVAAPTKPKIEFVVAPELEPPYRVLIHNDDVTPMDFVVAILRTIFELTIERAEAVMLTAHYTGGALVGSYPRDDAQRRIDEAHQLARLADYPLKFTAEPEA